MNYSNIISDFSVPGQTPITVGERMKATEPLYDILAKVYKIREPSGNKTSVVIQPDLKVENLAMSHKPERSILKKKTLEGIKKEAGISIPTPSALTSTWIKGTHEIGSPAEQKKTVSHGPTIKNNQARSSTYHANINTSGPRSETQGKTLAAETLSVKSHSLIFSPKVLSFIAVTCVCVGGYFLVKQIALNSKHRKKAN